MNKSFYQRLLDFIVSETKAETFDVFVEKARLSLNIKQKVETASVKIASLLPFQYFLTVYENNVIYRQKVYQKIKFRITLTQFEFEEKKLFLGHHFLNHMKPDTYLRNLIIIDENKKKMTVIKTKLPLDEATVFFYLSNFHLMVCNSGINPSEANVDSVNLTEWMNNNNFQSDDFIVVTTLDYAKGKYLLEKESHKDYLQNSLVIKSLNQKFTDALIQVVSEVKILKSTPVQILEAYWLSGVWMENMPIDSLKELITSIDNLEVKNMGRISTIVFNEIDLVKQIYQDVISGKLKQKYGIAKDLDGILDELNSSFTENTLYVMILLDIHRFHDFDLNRIFDIVFRRSFTFFINEKQQTNFMHAFNNLYLKVYKDYQLKNFGVTEYELLEYCLNIRLSLIDFLNELERSPYLRQPDFDITKLVHLKEINGVVETLLDLFKSPTLTLYDLALFKTIASNLEDDYLEEIKFLQKEFDI